EVQCPGHALEDARAPAELPALVFGLDPAAPAERDDRDLALAGLGSERALPDAEVEIPPPGGFRRHVLPHAVPPEELLRHASASSSCCRVSIGSEQASCAATRAPATVPRRTASTSSSPRRRPWPSAAAKASPAPSPLTTSTGKPGTCVSCSSSITVAPCSPRLSTSRGTEPSCAAATSSSLPITMSARLAASQASSGYSSGFSQSAGRQSRSKIVVPRCASSAPSVVSRLGDWARPVPAADRAPASA